jgi:hypothetical protein
VRREQARIEARWWRAAGEAERAQVARDAELLADRVEESLPGAPQDRGRTNLAADEVAHGTPAVTLGDELGREAAETWGWAKRKGEEAAGAAGGAGRLLLMGAGAVVALRLAGWLTNRKET